MRPRLFLITPIDGDLDRLPDRLGAALSGGDVASVLIDPEPFALEERQRMATMVVDLCHRADVAAILRNDTRLCGRSGADGVHVDTGLEDLDLAVERFRPKSIVGAGAGDQPP